MEIDSRASGHLLRMPAEKVWDFQKSSSSSHTVYQQTLVFFFSTQSTTRRSEQSFNRTDLWNPYQAPPAARNASSSHQRHWLLQENGLVHVSPSSAALPLSRSVFPWPLPVTGDVEDLRFAHRGVVLAEERERERGGWLGGWMGGWGGRWE